MASPRYTLNIKPEDLQPEQPKHEMTGKEKRENFWFYHKWHVIVGIVAALMVFSFVWEIATQVHPDYTIGILTTTGVPMGTGEALAEQLKPYFDDRNGDGEVVVSVMEYTIGKDADSIADPNVQMANITKLSGDIDGGESMLFLVDDMEYFQEQYMLFAYNDGTSPAEGEKPDYARMGVRWVGVSCSGRGLERLAATAASTSTPRITSAAATAAIRIHCQGSIRLPPFPFVHCRVRVWNTDIAFS